MINDEEINSKNKADDLESVALERIASRLYNREHNSEALKFFEKNAELFPDEPDVLANLALVYFTSGDKSRATEYAQRSLMIGKNNALVMELLKFVNK